MKKLLMFTLFIVIASLSVKAQTYPPRYGGLVYDQNYSGPQGYATFHLTLISSTDYSRTYSMTLDLPSNVTQAAYSTVNASDNSSGTYAINAFGNNNYGQSECTFTVYTWSGDLYLQWDIDYEDGSYQSYLGTVSANHFMYNQDLSF